MPIMDPGEVSRRALEELERIRDESERRLASAAEAASRDVREAARAAMELPKDSASLLERSAVVLTVDVEASMRDGIRYDEKDRDPRLKTVHMEMGRGSLRRDGDEYWTSGCLLLQNDSGYAKGVPVKPGRYRAVFLLIPLPVEEVKA